MPRLILTAAALASWSNGSAAAPGAVAPPSHGCADAASPAALMQCGRMEDARRLLDAEIAQNAANDQAIFLMGMIAIEEKSYRQAIDLFRSILIRHPEAARVRLELARAFFLAKDYRNAERQFRFARAGKPPAEVIANIDRFLMSIRQARNFTTSLSIAVAPDSNINTGSASREVDLYGLPFELDDRARRRSGVGLAVEAGTEWSPRLGATSRLRMGGAGQRREYQGTDFDDMAINLYAGPRFVVGRWDLSLLATGFRRWYGGRRYNQATGGRLELSFYLKPELILSANIGAQYVQYRQNRDMSGPLYSLASSAIYTFNTTSAATMKWGANRQVSHERAFANRSAYIAGGYYRDFAGGFSAYAEQSFTKTRYDDALPIFIKKRSDTAFSSTLAILNRHIILGRFTPRVAYTFSRQRSNIALYSFNRSKIEMGLTTIF